MGLENNQKTPYGRISASRKLIPLSEICDANDGIQTGPFGSQLHSSDYVDDGTPIITVEHLGENKIEGKNPPLVAIADVKRLSKYTLRDGDIVFSRVGSVDRRALVTSEQEGWMFSGRLLRVRPNRDLVDPTYLSYFFGLPQFKSYIRSIAVGATMPSLNTGLLSNVPIVFPPLREQRNIGEILGNLDAKIQINNLLLTSYSKIAEVLFKSWFIDFDPVKAKMAGEEPVGVDAETAALFPDSIEDSVAGSYPRGWRVGDLGEVLKIYDSKRIPVSSTERKKRFGNFPYYGATGILDYLDDYIFEGPHVLVGEDGTVITKAGTPVVQYVWGKFWVNNHAHVLQAKNGFSVEQLKLMLETVQVDNFVTGAVQLKLNQVNLKSIPCIIPDVFVSEAFNKIIQPLFAKIRILSEENQTLVALRDALLPKLISGELQIPEEMLTE